MDFGTISSYPEGRGVVAFDKWFGSVRLRAAISASNRHGRPRRDGFRPCVERLEERTLLNAGNPDPTFGVGGIASTQFIDSVDNEARAVAAQTDGKLVVAGDSGERPNLTIVSLTRYNLDGTLDSSFGAGGKVVTHLSGVSFVVAGVAVQPDQKILVAGSSGASFGVMRYNADGTLDTSFGTNGLVATNFSSGLTDKANALALQGDGKFLLAGSAEQPVNFSTIFALARYNPDGTLDTTFGTGGVVTTDFGGSNDSANAILVQPDGKIVTAGQTVHSSNSDFALARYNAGGSLDATFGVNGLVRTDFGRDDDEAHRIVLQVDKKLVVAGKSGILAALARYNPDGTLDASFGANGLLTNSFTTDVTGLALQADGQIVAGGTTGGTGDFTAARFNQLDGSTDSTFGAAGVVTGGFPDSSQALDLIVQGTKLVQVGRTDRFDTGFDFAVARYLPTGPLDPTFNATGRVVTDLEDTVESGGTIALFQPNSKIVVATTVGNFFGSLRTDFGLARFNGDGSLDTTFGTGGRVVTSFGGIDSVTGAVLAPDGKIIVAGQTGSSSHTDIALARYNPDGSLDSGFGAAGKVVSDFGDSINGTVTDVVVQADGKIVVLGTFQTPGVFFNLVRYNAAGTLDSGFGSGGVLGVTFGEHLALQPDGRLLVGANQGVARYNADGTLDPTFGSGGTIATGLLGEPGGFLALQPDGKILFAGSGASDAQTVVLRFNVNGTVDASFGIGGRIVLNGATGLGGFVVFPGPLAVQADGRIVLAGDMFFGRVLIRSRFVDRFDPNGTDDGSFTGPSSLPDSLGSLALQADGKILVTGATSGPAGVERLLTNDPLPTPNQRFVAQVYLDLLQRTADMGGFNSWVGLLNTGQATRQQVVSAIEASPEYRAIVVQQLFGLLLNRAAIGDELSAYSAFLGTGGTVEQMEAVLAGSPEYFHIHGSANDSFLDALYRDAFGRTVDATARRNFDQALASGALTPGQVAAQIFGSAEYFLDLAGALYRRFLHRQIDPTGLSNIIIVLEQGTPDQAIIAGIVGSDEYAARRT
jgi:uncharacterized delta-60 repeat protein